MPDLAMQIWQCHICSLVNYHVLRNAFSHLLCCYLLCADAKQWSEIRNTCSTHSAAGENNTSTYITQCTMYCLCTNILTATHILGFLAITPHMCPPRSQLTELLLQCRQKHQRPAPARPAPPCHHRGRGVANRVGEGCMDWPRGREKAQYQLANPSSEECAK